MESGSQEHETSNQVQDHLAANLSKPFSHAILTDSHGRAPIHLGAPRIPQQTHVHLHPDPEAGKSLLGFCVTETWHDLGTMRPSTWALNGSD